MNKHLDHFKHWEEHKDEDDVWIKNDPDCYYCAVLRGDIARAAQRQDRAASLARQTVDGGGEE